jgi:hypothetical protein
VSTAYVNSEKSGFIDEKIYEYPNDVNAKVESILKLTPDQLLQNEKSIISPWPNTYTFTKNLSERNLQKHRGSVPLLIVRPSIICSSISEPHPGWTDSLAAAGAMTIPGAIGL